MQLVLYMYQALCKPSVFEINGRQADYEDFGVQRDINPDPENPYGCGDMTFTRYTVPMLGIKEKYNIKKMIFYLILSVIVFYINIVFTLISFLYYSTN